MSNTQTTPIAERRLKALRFFSRMPAAQPMFAVLEGGNVMDALEQASCFLDAARDISAEVAEDAIDSRMWGAHYLIELSKAVLDAAIAGINEEKHHV